MDQHASTSSHPHSILAARPRFPDQWKSIDISQDELSLPNTLPVGQSFVWHRRPLRASTSVPTPSLPIDPITQLHEQEDHKHILLPSRPADISIPEQDSPLEEWSRAISSPDRVILLRQSSTKIYYTSILPSSDPSPTESDKSFIESYFSLSRSKLPSLPNLYRSWSHIDPALFGRAHSEGKLPRGVRVLRQDVWECLISFITSSANNVPRITSLMHRLSHHFSHPLLTLVDPPVSSDSDDGDSSDTKLIASTTTYHLFPRPERFLAVHDVKGKSEDRFVGVQDDLESILRDLGFGYRAGFIMNTLRCLVDEQCGDDDLKVVSGEGDDEAVKRVGEVIERFLISLRERERMVVVPASEKREVGKKSSIKGKGKEKEEVVQVKGDERWRRELLKFKGVGRKVADCIGLMSLDRPNVVPIDTHIQQIASRHPSFPSKLRNKNTSTESVYREVQLFLVRIWGGGGGGGGGGSCDHQDVSNSSEEEMIGEGMAGWVQAIMFAADLKGSAAVKLEDLIKVEDSMKEVVQEASRELLGYGIERIIKREEADDDDGLDIKPFIPELMKSWSIPIVSVGTMTPMTSTTSTCSDASPTDTAILTPNPLEASITSTKGSLVSMISEEIKVGKRKLEEDVMSVVDRVKRRRR